MEIIFLIIPLSVVLVFVIGVVFWWFVKSGQFEDLEGPAYRVVMDDDLPPDSASMDKDVSKDGESVRESTKV